jgi:hypothetical protein
MSSNTVRAGISEARARQTQRGGMTNAVMHNRDVETTRKLAVQNHVLLDQAMIVSSSQRVCSVEF